MEPLFMFGLRVTMQPLLPPVSREGDVNWMIAAVRAKIKRGGRLQRRPVEATAADAVGSQKSLRDRPGFTEGARLLRRCFPVAGSLSIALADESVYDAYSHSMVAGGLVEMS